MAERTIALLGRGIQKEAKAAGAITPGHLVALDSSGDLIVHAAAGLNASRAFAKENEVIGKGITVAYASGDNVIYEAFPPGAEVYALVNGTAAALAIGDFLESAGDGTLQKLATDAATDDTQRASVVAIALSTTAGSTAERVIVEVL